MGWWDELFGEIHHVADFEPFGPKTAENWPKKGCSAHRRRVDSSASVVFTVEFALFMLVYNNILTNHSHVLLGQH